MGETFSSVLKALHPLYTSNMGENIINFNTPCILNEHSGVNWRLTGWAHLWRGAGVVPHLAGFGFGLFGFRSHSYYISMWFGFLSGVPRLMILFPFCRDRFVFFNLFCMFYALNFAHIQFIFFWWINYQIIKLNRLHVKLRFINAILHAIINSICLLDGMFFCLGGVSVGFGCLNTSPGFNFRGWALGN